MLEHEQHILYVFPGQGSQYAGMGSDLHEEFAVARKIYAEAGEVLGYDIAELSFADPEDKLNLTRYTQPALLTHSVACLEIFRELTDDRLKPAITAGHSLGEYTALVAAKVLSFEGALRLVQKRGELMGTHGEGEMTAFPLALDVIKPIAEKFNCAVAGCNLPEQTVVGGRSEDLEKVEQEVKENFRRKRPVRLKTEGAFHTFYMNKAAELFRPVLEEATFESAEARVLSNYTGGYHEDDPAKIRDGLYYQLRNPVLWHANLLTAFGDGVKMIFEFGGGIGPAETPDGKRPNLEGMIKKASLAAEHEAQYRSAINLQSVRETSDFVNNPEAG
jgi:[acyl-carrier-protein] S-malonyltransferase